MTDLPALLERVRAATGADRELDKSIAVIIGGWADTQHGWRSPEGALYETWRFDHYTASIDASIALVERLLPGQVWIILDRAMRIVSEDSNRLISDITVQQIVRAILAALLTALIAKERTS